MGEPIKLSADDLAGAEELPAVRLSPEEIAGAEPLEPAPDDRGFFQRAIDTVKSGAHAVGHVGSQFAHHPIDTATNPAKRREFERGVDDMVTLGYGQKLAARVGNALGDKPDVAIGPETFGGGVKGSGGASVANAQQADAAAAPEYRTAGSIAGSFAPGAASAIAKAPGLALRGAGKFMPGAANAVAHAGEAAVNKVASVPMVGKMLAPGVAAAGGAARGLAEYETTAIPIAALSANAEGHRHEAAHAAASDPLGLITSTVGGALPAGAREGTKQAKRYVEHAPTAADAWIVNDIRGQRAGDSTPTARKYLAEDEADVQAVVKSDPKLRGALEAARHGDKAKLEAASQQVRGKIAEVNAPRTEAYDKHVDGALGGGIRAGEFIGDLRHQAEELRADGTAGGHKMAAYLEARANELERSRDWGAEQHHELAGGAGSDVAGLKKLRENTRNPTAAQALDDEIARLSAGARTSVVHNPDAIVPTRTARKVVSDIQDAAYDGLGGMSDTRAAGQARHVAAVVKNVFDKYLDTAAQKSPETALAVDQIRAINVQHGALKNIERVIDQRLNKAQQNAGGAGGSEMLKHGLRTFAHGNVGLLAGERLLHGHPGQAAAVVGAAALPAAKRALDTHVAGNQPAYLRAVDRLARAAKASASASEFVREAVSAGLGVADARRIYEAAHPSTATNPPPN